MRPFRQLPFRDVPDAPRVPHPYFELPSRDVVVPSRHFGETRIHLREIGDGPPLLLVHGLMTTGYSFRYVAAPLAEAGYRVIIPDLPGCGRSAKPDVSYTADAVATFVGELIDALGIEGCAALGNSLGGSLCVRLALRRPTIFSCLVDLHSPARAEARMYALHGALSVPGSHALLRAIMRHDVERWAHRNVHYFDETLKSREEAREYGAPLGTEEGGRAFARILHETVDPAGFRALERELRVRRDGGEPFPIPLLLLYARRDPMVSPDNGPYLKALIPDAELRWLEEGSHFAHVDAPAAVLEVVLEHLGASRIPG